MPEPRPADDDAPRILAERERWLVIAKPAGWHAVAQAGGGERSVEGWLRAARPEQGALHEAGLVHRLDFGTSGCLVAARDADSYDRLRESFSSAGGARKRYLALARTGLEEQGSFRLYFASRHKSSRKVTVRGDGSAPECGRCRWRVLARRVDGAHDLVEIELVGRGRRHQVRAGLAHLGHPLRGDALYGGSTAQEEHPALHAWSVEIDGERIECPPDGRFGPVQGSQEAVSSL
ncbi:MAG: RNA pseudouridine synthase [Phycisphaerales bacterium]